MVEWDRSGGNVSRLGEVCGAGMRYPGRRSEVPPSLTRSQARTPASPSTAPSQPHLGLPPSSYPPSYHPSYHHASPLASPLLAVLACYPPLTMPRTSAHAISAATPAPRSCPKPRTSVPSIYTMDPPLDRAAGPRDSLPLPMNALLRFLDSIASTGNFSSDGLVGPLCLGLSQVAFGTT
ncbi:hypothetical protein ANO11243_089540 [Dothideomycetidae sp. 11243]|nr:hypothetical protein ANO11243_089540 [fungal sp. No.11243]